MDNTGNWNTGYSNTGDRNTGYSNTGDWNTGNWNTGDWNTWHCNTGDRNAGYWNTGNWNTGNWNTGYWNTGDWNTWYCNTITPDECLIFNKIGSRKEWDKAYKPNWIYAKLTEWIEKKDMTDKEKEDNPSYVTTWWYLKYYDSLQHAYKESWLKASKEDKELTFKLPNFDVEVFKEIFWFDPIIDNKKTIIIDWKEIQISESSYEELKKSLINK